MDHPTPILCLCGDEPPDALARIGTRIERFDSVESLLAQLAAGHGATVVLPAAALSSFQYAAATAEPEPAAIPRAAIVVWGEQAQCLRALADGADFAGPQPDAAMIESLHAAQSHLPYIHLHEPGDACWQPLRAALSRAGCPLPEPSDAGLADIVLMRADADRLAFLARIAAVRPRLGPDAILLVSDPKPPIWFEDQALLAGADAVVGAVLPDRGFIRQLWRHWERRFLRARARSGATPAANTGQLRRDDFLRLLARRLALPDPRPQALVSLCIDQEQAVAGMSFAETCALERALAERLQATLSPADAWTTWLELGFGILVRRDCQTALREVAEGVRRSIAAAAFALGERELELTVSIGIALPPSGGGLATPDRWFAAAHAAQSMAHRLGGNRVDGMIGSARGRLPDERALIVREWLKEAARGRQLQVEFQPVLGLRKPAGPGMYAVLTRLRDPRSPLAGVDRSDYIELARQRGVQAVIDRFTLFQAFEALAELDQRGIAARMLVQVDLASFNRGQQLWLQKERQRRGALAGRVVIELEAALLRERPALHGVLRFLHGEAVPICLFDDAGSLAGIGDLPAAEPMLLRLPLGTVEGADRQALNAVASPWRAAGRGLIVDGVERLDHFKAVRELGIDWVMGSAIGAPSLRPDFDFFDEG